MAIPSTGTVGEQKAANSPRVRVKGLVSKWEGLRNEIRELNNIIDREETTGTDPQLADRLRRELRGLQEQREDIVDDIQRIVRQQPQLARVAVNNGFRKDLLPEDTGPGTTGTGTSNEATLTGATGGQPGASGGGAGGGGGGSGAGGGGKGGKGGGGGGGGIGKNHGLPGIKGKDFVVVKGPKGSLVAVYSVKVGNNSIKVGVRLPRNEKDLAKYGIKPGDARQLNAQQMERIYSSGHADDIAAHFRGEKKNPFAALERKLRLQYGGQPILNNDQVLGVLIQKAIYKWDTGTYENQLRKTKWYSNTNSYQREYALVISKEERQERRKRYMQMVVNDLEDLYGLDWMKHVKGGMKQAKDWADKIASGKWGEPSEGFAFWRDNQFDKAKAIDGTPAWITEQQEAEAAREYNNRPEEMAEKLRDEARAYLGPQFAPDHDTLMKWSTKLVTQVASTEDWMQWLRKQSKALHPWKDANVAWEDVASSYRGMAQDVLRTPLSYDDKLFAKLGSEDGKGPISAHDFNLLVRQDDRAWDEGTKLFDEVTGFGSQLANIFQGVSF